MMLLLCVLLVLVTSGIANFSVDVLAPRNGDVLIARHDSTGSSSRGGSGSGSEEGDGYDYSFEFIAVIIDLNAPTRLTEDVDDVLKETVYAIDLLLYDSTAEDSKEDPESVTSYVNVSSMHNPSNVFAYNRFQLNKRTKASINLDINIYVFNDAGEKQSIMARKTLTIILGSLSDVNVRGKYDIDFFKSGLRVCSPVLSSTLQPMASQQSPSSSCTLDYIEIGTSNFNTVAHKAYSMNMLYQSKKPLIYGISIEAIDSYLYQLPQNPSNILVNAAIALNHVDKHSPSLSSVYYLLESTIDKLKAPSFLKGCSMVGNIHNGIIEYLRQHKYPYELIQRSHVPQLSMDVLLETVVVDAGYDQIGLLKLDLEGIDRHLVQQTLDFFAFSEIAVNNVGEISSNVDGVKDEEKRTISPPCIIFFETWEGLKTNDSLLVNLNNKGYQFVHDLPVIQSKLNNPDMLHYEIEDIAAVLCSCSDSVILRAASLLHDFTPTLAVDACKQASQARPIVTKTG